MTDVELAEQIFNRAREVCYPAFIYPPGSWKDGHPGVMRRPWLSLIITLRSLGWEPPRDAE